MSIPPRTRSFAARSAAAAALVVACAIASAPAEVVILKDGFVIQGNVRKEMESVRDTATGKDVLVFKGAGFDTIDDGPRITVFSSHHKQLGEINKDIKLRPDYKAYTNPIPARRANNQLPQMLGAKSMPDFNEKWRRTLRINTPEGFVDIDQQVTYLDPYCCFVVSSNFNWSQAFRTSEMDQRKVRKLLSTHPELVEADGKPDPVKRVAIARFMKDAGWLLSAKEEIDQLKKVVPDPLPKDAQEQLDKLLKDMDVVTAELVVSEADKALNAGRYAYATDLLAAFPDKTADPKERDRATKLMAQLKAAREQYDTGRRLLRSLIDEVTGTKSAQPFLAVGGGSLVAVVPKKGATALPTGLVEAAETVLTELHPDSAGRIEFFVNLAAQTEREKAQGTPPTKTPAELLATAVSGWAKGKNGATPVADKAIQIWRARAAVLEYQRATVQNERHAVLTTYRKNNPIGIDELAQVISLLPPAEPENLQARTGSPVQGNGVPDGIFKRRSAPYGEHLAGIDYLVKLPPEYHHGRAYPVLMVLTYPGLAAEQLMGPLAAEADKHGYIMVAPLWTIPFDGKSVWGWKGEDHDYVTGALRDVVRHFTVDNDKVFMIGGGAGADMAMDVGMSHPDLFAGVVALGPTPRWQGMFMYYWQNAQKLPFYVVTGQLAEPGNTLLRHIFDRWMPNGFPALEVVYRGRGIEWYPAETSVMFDWMGRKKRANGTSTLQLGTGRRFSWQTMRESDNRFYWLGAEAIHPGNLAAGAKVGRDVLPAYLQGDIKGNNLIALESRGVRQIGVWIGLDMIDWAKPVQVTINRRVPNEWKRPKVLEQDLQVLLEDYWVRGDRRMLYLAKLEFHSQD